MTRRRKSSSSEPASQGLFASHLVEQYEFPVYRCTLVREGTISTEKRRVNSPEDAVTILEPQFTGADREKFLLLLLDARNQVVGLNVATVGTLTETAVQPREVFKPALLGLATSIILAHNHPTGDPEPSPEDIATTKHLQEAGRILKIAVVDHLIIGDDGHWVSLARRGLL